MAFAYTRQLVGIYSSGAETGLSLLVVPAGRRYVLRDISLGNWTAASAHVEVYARVQTGYPIALWRTDVPAAGSAHLDLRQALEAGDELFCTIDPGGASIAVTGYDLDAN